MQCIWISRLVLEMSYCSFYGFLHPQDKIDMYARTKRRTREGTCGSVYLKRESLGLFSCFCLAVALCVCLFSSLFSYSRKAVMNIYPGGGTSSRFGHQSVLWFYPLSLANKCRTGLCVLEIAMPP